MLLEITDSFWINIDKILFIVKEKTTGEWHLHFSDDPRKSHLALTDSEMDKLLDIVIPRSLPPFAPSTCL